MAIRYVASIGERLRERDSCNASSINRPAWPVRRWCSIFIGAPIPDRHEPIRSDLAVTAAASICHTLMLMQQQFGLLSNGRDAADRDDRKSAAQIRNARKGSRSVVMRGKSDRLHRVVIPTAQAVQPTFSMSARPGSARTHRWHVARRAADRIAKPSVTRCIGDGHLARSRRIRCLRSTGYVQQGYAVSAIVNNYENEAFTTASARLMTQHIAVYHLLSEDSIPEICKACMLKF